MRVRLLIILAMIIDEIAAWSKELSISSHLYKINETIFETIDVIDKVKESRKK